MPPKFPDGKPKSSEILQSGKIRHVMKDGRVFELRPKPDYRMSYQSSLYGSKPGDEYNVDVSILGKTKNEDYFEVWNFARNELRWYQYDKLIRLTDLETGKTFDGYSVWKTLNPDAEGDDMM